MCLQLCVQPNVILKSTDQGLCIAYCIFGSVYFTENSGYRSLKNRSCVTVFGSCSVTLTVGELLGDVSCSANHDFRTSVTRIFGEIDASFFFCLKQCGLHID